MNPLVLEITLFVIAVVGVVGLGIWKSRDEVHAEEAGASGYFLAGRGLTWWLVGFSLIAANISTEQFVGMSGSSANWLGMAIASYEWMAAVTLVFVAFFFLPKFLKVGIYTIPEFLEYRYGIAARLAMAILTILVLVLVPTASVIFSGAKFVSEYYHEVPVLNNLTAACWLIGGLAAFYVFIGGLKACAWTDLVWGSALILGGAIVMWFAFEALAERPAEDLIKTKVANSEATVQDLQNAGAWERFMLLNDGKDGEAVAQNGPNGSGGKVHMIRPKEDSDLPWTALLLGLWIPNFFYWGLNQYIVQRTLGSKSLAEGQKGIVFAAFLKLIIPFVVVIPGILAFNLFSGSLHNSAAKKNLKAIEAIEQAGELKTFIVTERFVQLQPDLLPRILEHNAKLAGAAVPSIAGLVPSKTGDAEKITKQINDLSAAAIKKTEKIDDKKQKITEGPKLVGYDYDSAFPVLVRELIKKYWYISWFVIAALFGAVVSSLASMLNSASTIATMDLYQKATGVTDEKKLVGMGRVFVVLFVLIAAFVAPNFDNPKLGGIFKIIQEFQGFISPGILAVFAFGLLVRKGPAICGVAGLLTNIVAYGALKFVAPQIQFLNRMAICFGLCLAVMALITAARPLAQPVEFKAQTTIALEGSKGAKLAGLAVIAVTLLFYVIFSPLGVAR
jgi:SSS family solute:Na+ symporter